jgi:gluconolactonase
MHRSFVAISHHANNPRKDNFMKTLATGLQFPEGPIAMVDGSVILVELARQTLTRVLSDGRTEVIVEIEGGPNGAAVGPDNCIYVCNNGGFEWLRDNGTFRPHLQSHTYKRGSIDVFDLKSGALRRLYDNCNGNPLKGPNDLVFDDSGGFWFTDLGKRRERDMDRGFVYWAKADGSEIREVIGPIVTPNGIGISPDGKWLYVAETETGRLWKWEIVAPGQLRKRPWPAYGGGELVAGIGGFTRFDSLSVASSGNICVAALHSCAVMEISPDGNHVRTHSMPDLGVTNLCFGGPDLRKAYVTLSHDGKLVVLDWHEPGLRLNYQTLPDL